MMLDQHSLHIARHAEIRCSLSIRDVVALIDITDDQHAITLHLSDTSLERLADAVAVARERMARSHARTERAAKRESPR